MNKIVNCGCGGEAEIFHIAPEGYEGSYCVRCTKCLTQTPFFNKDKDKAIEVWNIAMSGVVYPCTTPKGVYTGGCTITNTTDDKNDFHPVYDCMVGKERTAKVVKGSNNMITVAACGDCGTVVNIFDKYCARCGARLEWE